MKAEMLVEWLVDLMAGMLGWQLDRRLVVHLAGKKAEMTAKMLDYWVDW